MTNYSYNDAVPATNNDPSVDQPDMLINAQSIKGIIGQDHIAFGANNGGFHKAINFDNSSSYVPVAAASTAKLFIDPAVSTAPTLKFFGGDAAHSSSQYVLGAADGANGSVVLMGGIILKWFTKQVTAAHTAITFTDVTIAVGDFPNYAFAAVITLQKATLGGTNETWGYSALTKTGMTINQPSANIQTVTVFVIGN